MTKIKKLTPEQEAELPKFRQKYLDIACNGSRINRNELESALADAYDIIGKPAPKVFIFDSPAACMLAIKIFQMGDESMSQLYSQLSSQLESQLSSQLSSQLDSQLGSQLESQLYSQLYSQLSSQLSSQLYSQKIYNSNYLLGSHNLYWIAYYRFALDIGITVPEEVSNNLDIIKRISSQCEWWWPFENIVIVSEKPTMVKWDGENRLHNETGPAVEYADGYSLYSWRGIAIPENWIADGPPESKDIMRIENIEQRRIACEMRGWHNILPDIGAVLIDKHKNPQVGELWEADLPDNGLERFLKVECGTGRTFAIPVGMEYNTAREANAGTYGIAPQILDMLELRT